MSVRVREVSTVALRLDCEKSIRTWNSQRNIKTANALRDSEHFNLQFLFVYIRSLL